MGTLIQTLLLCTVFSFAQAKQDAATRSTIPEYNPPQGADLVAIYSEARAAARSGDHEQATAILLWLWDHSLERDPAYYGVRLGSVVTRTHGGGGAFSTSACCHPGAAGSATERDR